MAKMTLLDMVQNISTDMGVDKVNSIGDTQESSDIASIIKDTYFYFIEERNRSWLKTLTSLDSATASNPVKMKIPDSISQVISVKYDKIKSGDTDKAIRNIDYLETHDFLDVMYRRPDSATNVDVITDPAYDVPFLILNDIGPTYWTSFDDEYIIFDSYDSGIDSFLQNSKSIIQAYQTPVWTHEDGFIPDVPTHLFPLFLAESKAAAFVVIKQVADPKSETRARKLKTREQYAQNRTSKHGTGPNYGRK